MTASEPSVVEEVTKRDPPEMTPATVASSSAVCVEDLECDAVQITGTGCAAAATAAALTAHEAEGELCAHCTRTFQVSVMQNYGCKNYPKWRCRACHAAARALERAAKSRGEQHYQRFCEMRRQHPLRFSDLVLQCRVSPDGEEPLEGQEELWMDRCKSAKDRRERMARIVKTVFSVKAIEEYEDVRFLTERQFRAHMRYSEDMTAAEAQNAWDKAVVSSEVEKKHLRSGAVTVAVSVAMGVRTFSQKGSKRALETFSDVDDSDAEKDGSANPESASALKRLRSHASGDIGNFIKQPGQDLQSKVFPVPPCNRVQVGGGASVRDVMRTLAGGESGHSSKSGGKAAMDGKGHGKGKTEKDDVLEIPGSDDVAKMGLTKAKPACFSLVSV